MEKSPVIAKVLARYPDLAPSSLNFPPDAAEWSEKEVDLFVGSAGFIKPKRPKAAKPAGQAAPAYAEVKPPAATAAADSAAEEAVPVKTPAAPAAPVVSTPADAGTAPSEEAVLPELPLTRWHKDAYWAPYATYMEDVGEKGLRLVAALNKCERFRNVGLKKGAGFNLNTLKERFGAGILLREFALEMVAKDIPSGIMSMLWVSLRLELPCSPFMPMYQVMVPEGSSEVVCKGVFGMLMLNTATMSVLEDGSIYEKVAAPLRSAFGLKKPDGKEGVPKFPRIYPTRGSPFSPTHGDLAWHQQLERQLLCTSYTIMPSDCDMYRVIFHPQMVSVCEKVNYAVGAPFCREPAVAIYANLAKPAGVDDCFDVRIFVEAVAGQFRVLYLFTAKSAPGGGVMAAFLVYGSPPGALFSEDVSACAATKFKSLEAFAGASSVCAAADKVLDLTRST
ncbi:unnamed protein product [Effrenium voratum]|uniref:Uncharacterized protein n=1 Tax=Effrenium voratum TaxID=2562239 RepID=A0AA36IMH6_9DINO|nr:unnamed protein product [Effrenium voratum]CAJ1438020.1 unnamed protein product [Effrenium voratum]